MPETPAKCPHASDCELYHTLMIQAALRVWQVFYCNTPDRHRDCERFKRAARGEVVPPDLLPSGASIASAPKTKSA